MGAQVSHIQTSTPAEFEENFRQYGEQGYTLVFGHGFEFQDAARRVAPAYPNTVFVCTSGDAIADNLAGMNFAFEEASFQAGMIAGALTSTGVIGAIGGQQLPTVRASFVAFERGARMLNPRLEARIPSALRARVASVGVVIREGRFHEMDDVLRPADGNEPHETAELVNGKVARR